MTLIGNRLYNIEASLLEIHNILSSPKEDPLPPWDPLKVEFKQASPQEGVPPSEETISVSSRLSSLEDDVIALYEVYSDLVNRTSEDIDDVNADLDHLRGSLWNLRASPNDDLNFSINPPCNED